MSCSGTCWLLGGAWFQCRYGGFWLSTCLLTFPGIRSSLVFSSFGFEPPASDFQSYSYSSLKTSPSLGHTERFTELHGEEKREKGDRGQQGEKKGNQKGRDQSSQ